MSSPPSQTGGFVIQVADQDRFKIAQAFYNAVTGKTEKLTKLYDKNFKIDSGALTQLHTKLCQLQGPWTVLETSNSVTVHHTNDSSEQFSSFERFGIYDASRTQPVEGITYQQNILIEMSKIARPQSYTITVRIGSRSARLDRLQPGMPPPAFFRFFERGLITLEIDYVDYTIARNIQGTVDSWIAEIEIIPESNCLIWLQDRSEWIPRILQIAIFAVAFTVSASLANKLPEDAAPKEAALLVIFALPFIWVSSQIARLLGHRLEDCVNHYSPISYIELNVGDKRLAERARNRNTDYAGRFVVWLVIVLVEGVSIGLFTNWLYDKIF